MAATTVGMRMFPNHISTKELFHYGLTAAQNGFDEWNDCSSAKSAWKNFVGSAAATLGLNTHTHIPLKNITKMPVGLFVGDHDNLGSPELVNWLAPQLGNVVHHEVYPAMAHSSFLMGKNMSYVDNLISLVK